MTLNEIICGLHHQHERYRGSGTRLETVLIEAATEIERLRGVLATREWVARSEREPDPMRQCLLFTNHLDGFVWIGRRGVLPQDVSHWMYLPEPPRPQPQ
jgi:hypothetical protein